MHRLVAFARSECLAWSGRLQVGARVGIDSGEAWRKLKEWCGNKKEQRLPKMAAPHCCVEGREDRRVGGGDDQVRVRGASW